MSFFAMRKHQRDVSAEHDAALHPPNCASVPALYAWQVGIGAIGVFPVYDAKTYDLVRPARHLRPWNSRRAPEKQSVPGVSI
jgi:hypothetical protein